MQVILRLENFQLRNENKKWYEKTDHLSVLTDITATLIKNKCFDFYYRFGDDKIRKLDSIRQIVELVKEHGEDTYVLQDSDASKPSCSFRLEITEFGFSIAYALYQVNGIPALQIIFSEMIDFTIAVYEVFQKDYLIGYRLGIEVFDVEGYTPDYNRLNDYWEGSKLVDFLSKEYHKESENGRSEDWGKLSEYKFPENVKKVKKDDLLIIQWAKEPATEKEIRDALKFRDEWLFENIEPIN
jgi:hypothetical protein